MGYVYKFINKESGKWYIGSHNKPSAGSNYSGSGTLWQRALRKYDIDAFEKHILYEGDLYREEEERILTELDAANDPMSYNLKNTAFGGSFFGEQNGMYGKHHTPEARYKCGNAFRGKKRPDHAEKMKGERNPVFGKNNHTYGLINYTEKCRGKTYEDIHGEEKAAELRIKLSASQTGILKPHLSEMYAGEGNPFYGKTHTEESRQKMAKQWESEERHEKHAEAMKIAGEKRRGIIATQLYVMDKCVYCALEATKSNISKWHNENCKLNPANSDNILGEFVYIQCPHCDIRCNTTNSNSRRNFKVYHLQNCKHKKSIDEDIL